MANCYCNNSRCEYHEDGLCEYEDVLLIDENGMCARFVYAVDDDSDA